MKKPTSKTTLPIWINTLLLILLVLLLWSSLGSNSIFASANSKPIQALVTPTPALPSPEPALSAESPAETASVPLDGVDIEKPVVTWVAPVTNGLVKEVGSGMVTLTVTATDNNGIARVNFSRWDAVTEKWIPLSDISSEPYTYNLDCKTLNMGWNQVNAYAVDLAGNYSDTRYIWLNRKNPVPSVPTTISPVGSNIVARPTFVWSRVNYATSYRLVVYDVSSAKNVTDITVNSKYCSTTTNRCTYKPAPTLGNNRNYSWKVWAQNESGASPYSVFKNFKVAPGFFSHFTSGTGWTSVNGTWKVYSTVPGYFKTTGAPAEFASAAYNATFSTLDYQVHMKRTGCSTCSNSIIIRGTTAPLSQIDRYWFKGYYFQYANDGKFSVLKLNGSNYIFLKDWKTTTFIAPNDWNTLRVTASGTSLKFFINDHLVWYGTDSSLTSGKVGVAMWRPYKSTDAFYVDWTRLTAAVAPSAIEMPEPLAESGEEFPEWTDPRTSPH